MNKLTKLSDIFNNLKFTKTEREDFKFLEQCVENFFPTKAQIAQLLQKFCDNEMHNVLALRFEKNPSRNEQSLLVHSTDDAWVADFLANYAFNDLENHIHKSNAVQVFLSEEVRAKELNQLIANAAKYVKSKNFQAKRLEFQRDIVKAYIENWLILSGDDFASTKAKKQEMCLSVNFDKEFRDEITFAMQALNIEKEVIESALETFKNQWLGKVTTIAFENHCKKEFDKDYQYMAVEDPRYGYYWRNLRYFEYFNAHKDSIEKYCDGTTDFVIRGKQRVETFYQHTSFDTHEVLEMACNCARKQVHEKIHEKKLDNGKGMN